MSFPPLASFALQPARLESRERSASEHVFAPSSVTSGREVPRLGEEPRISRPSSKDRSPGDVFGSGGRGMSRATINVMQAVDKLAIVWVARERG